MSKIKETLSLKESLLAQVDEKNMLPKVAMWNGKEEEFDAKAVVIGILSTEDKDIRSLKELNQLVRQGRTSSVKKSTAPALGKSMNSIRRVVIDVNSPQKRVFFI